MAADGNLNEHDPLAGRGGRRAITRAVILALLASAIGITVGLLIPWFPAQGSKQAKPIDTLWDVLIACSVPIFVAVATIVLFSAKEFRVREGQEHLDGPPIHGNTKLEIVWTTIPAVMLVSLCTYAYLVLHDVEKAPAAGIAERHIAVEGQQFAWNFTYHEQGKTFSTTQLYVPIDESVRFDVTTKDVLHDFWVPEWRMKIDAVPGLTTGYRITPIKITGPKGYPVICAELCGLGHAFMRSTAHVLSKPAYAAWVNRMVAHTSPAPVTTSGTASAPAVDAKALFTSGDQTTGATACGSCHTLADAGTSGQVGPNLDKVLKGKDVAFIRQSILDPDAVVATGYDKGIMPPNFGKLLSTPQVDALVNYLERVAAK